MSDARELYQLERLAELGRLSASLLHEMSQPLTAALLYLEQADNHQPAHIQQVRHHIQLLHRYVEAARQQVRRESTVSRFDVRPQLDQLRQVLLPLARHQGVRLRLEPTANHVLYGDPVKFQQIMANLVINAIDAYAESPGPPELKQVIVTLSSKQQWLYVRVQDRGHGIAANQIAHIFKPFYTTKHCRGQGLGMGLDIVKQHAEKAFSGSVTVSSSRRTGTVFTAKLRLTPRYQPRLSGPEAYDMV